MPRKQAKEEYIPPEERCLNRLTSEKTIQLFGDGIHKFFLEQRCTDRRLEDRPICLKCSMPNVSIKQYARTFPRGMIYQPLPPKVHLFDSEWYHQSVIKWGPPSEETIALARQFQQEARQGYEHILHPKVQEPSLDSLEMPKRAVKKPVITEPTEPTEPVKKARKPRMKKTVESQEPEQEQEQEPKGLVISEEVSNEPAKKIRRPRTKKTAVSEPPPPMDPVPTTYPPSHPSPVLQLFQEQKQEPEPKKPRARRSPVKTKKTESDKPVHPLSAFHRDSCIPTYLEEKMEEQSISDYETETVSLSVFILDNVVYFRDAKKNKLYRRIKEKTIGPYIGRYDPQTDSLVTDVPDSDDES